MTARPVATLPMYDLPEVRGATDGLWAALRAAFREAGVAAPARLSRDVEPPAAWLDPRLVMGQACGLPFVRRLRGRVALLGAPDYGVAGAPPGHYVSAVIVRAGDPRSALAAFRGAVAAVNEVGSQSGHAALMHPAAPLARDGRFFAGVRLTGAHAASVAAVAAGAADIAAIDAVTWRLLQRHRPEAARVRVLMTTDPTPGLPLIAAAGTDPARHRAVLSAVLGGLPAWIGDALGIRGFVPLEPDAYDVVRARWARVEALFVDTPTHAAQGV